MAKDRNFGSLTIELLAAGWPCVTTLIPVAVERSVRNVVPKALDRYHALADGEHCRPPAGGEDTRLWKMEAKIARNNPAPLSPRASGCAAVGVSYGRNE